jgi:hypothetical protein
MKLKVCLIALFFSFCLFGEETNISPQMFSQIILPSAKKLVEDYYVLLVKLDPFNKEVILLRDNVSDLKKRWQDYSSICISSPEKCKEGFSALKNDFIQENKNILKIENDFKLTSKSSKNITDSRVLLSKTLSHISDDSHKILTLLDLFKFNRKEFFVITDHLKDIKLNLNILTTGLLDDDYQDNFYFIYSNFFKMLENDIIEKSNLELFKRELVNLNISWNTFNMKVPKWKASLPPDSLALLDSMHKRWNSILKLVWGGGT